jgi:hypothetical protein
MVVIVVQKLLCNINFSNVCDDFVVIGFFVIVFFLFCERGILLQYSDITQICHRVTFC